MKGPNTSPRPLRRNLVLPIWRAHIPLQGLLQGVCSTYMKGPDTSPRPLRRSLFYLYKGPIYLSKASSKEFVLLIWRAHIPLQGLLEGICSTYMKGPYTFPRPLRRSLFYLYEGPICLSKTSWKEFVLPIWRAHIPLQGLLEGACSTYMKGPYTPPRPLRRSLFYLYEGPIYLSKAS